MDRSLIGLNVPNFITIGIMAIAAFFLFGVAWQFISRALPSGGEGGGGEGADFSGAVE